MRSRMWLLLVALLAGAGLVVVAPASPAGACSCMPFTAEKAFASSDVVFAGDVLERPAPAPGEVTWIFAVDEVFKGQANLEQAIVTSGSGGSCRLELFEQGRVLVFATRNPAASGQVAEPGALYASVCGGTRMWADLPRGQRPGVPADTFPPGSAPLGADPPGSAPLGADPPGSAPLGADPPSSTAGEGEGADVTIQAAAVAPSSGEDASVAWGAIGIAAVVVVGAVAVVVKRRRRPPPSDGEPPGLGEPSASH